MAEPNRPRYTTAGCKKRTIGNRSRHRTAGREKRAIGNRKSKMSHVPLDEIRNNKYDLSISRYKEIEHKEIEYEKPEVIMAKIQSLESDIDVLVGEIGKML